MFTVRGVNLFPSQVEEIVRRHREVTDFVIERRRERQMDEVAVLIETAVGGFSTERLEAELRLALGVRLDCRVVETGTLPSSGLKSKRIVSVDRTDRVDRTGRTGRIDGTDRTGRIDGIDP
jgi:phenylacetate-CoA ligase